MHTARESWLHGVSSASFRLQVRFLVGLTGVVKLENVFNGFRLMIAAIKLIRTMLRTSRIRGENMS
jgi:hypothetical protein